jgi:hypothetical protein
MVPTNTTMQQLPNSTVIGQTKSASVYHLKNTGIYFFNFDMVQIYVSLIVQISEFVANLQDVEL